MDWKENPLERRRKEEREREKFHVNVCDNLPVKQPWYFADETREYHPSKPYRMSFSRNVALWDQSAPLLRRDAHVEEDGCADARPGNQVKNGPVALLPSPPLAAGRTIDTRKRFENTRPDPSQRSLHFPLEFTDDPVALTLPVSLGPGLSKSLLDPIPPPSLSIVWLSRSWYPMHDEGFHREFGDD